MSKMGHNEYYMRIAAVVAMRGTCDRRQCGAVLVAGDRVLSTGFNGAPSGLPECDEVGHLMDECGHCIRTIHAEANAVLEVGINKIRNFIQLGQELTMYATTFPCHYCMKLIVQAGINRIVYGGEYRDDSHISDAMSYGFDVSRQLGIELIPFPMEGFK